MAQVGFEPRPCRLQSRRFNRLTTLPTMLFTTLPTKLQCQCSAEIANLFEREKNESLIKNKTVYFFLLMLMLNENKKVLKFYIFLS